jgi:hypothetical protein
VATWLAAIAMAAAQLACATASDVERRGQAVLDATDPEQNAFCPPEHLAVARAEVAFARAAAERGEALAAATHLAQAERRAAAVKAEHATCGATATPLPVPQPVPLADDDDDGVPNATDRCLTEREDRDGYLDEDGCPDPDDDGDGLSDVIDKCPREPEDEDGYEDLDGCPEPGGPGD